MTEFHKISLKLTGLAKLHMKMILALDWKAYSQVADAFYNFQTIIPDPFNLENREKLHAEISTRAKHMEHTLQVLHERNRQHLEMLN